MRKVTVLQRVLQRFVPDGALRSPIDWHAPRDPRDTDELIDEYRRTGRIDPYCCYPMLEPHLRSKEPTAMQRLLEGHIRAIASAMHPSKPEEGES